MKLQLANGSIERPIGLLEKVIVTACGVEYEHTFAVVDFGKSPNYDIILGRPFMRQLKMIQDWGSNFIYLRQQKAITRVNLIDHSYRDVARTPVDDFESTSAEDDSSIPSWVNSRIHTWLCGASDNESLNKEHSIDKMFFHDEDCNIVPLCTIEVVSSSEESSEESQQVGMHDQFPMMPKMVQQGDKIIWNKYPWENSQDGASFPDDPKYCPVTSVTRPIVVEQAKANIDYNVKLRLVREAKNGALIYRDTHHREVVKMSDNSPKVDAIWASYQDDHYIGKDGVTYQVIPINGKIPQWWESSLVPTKVVKQQPKNAKDKSQPLNNQEFEQSCTCGDCGTTHLLKDCPMLMTNIKVPLGNATETPTAADPQKEKSLRSSSQSSPKASSKSSPKSPQKRQILPQQTTDLLKSQVIELTTDNTKLDQAGAASLQFPITAQQRNEKRGPEGANSQEDLPRRRLHKHAQGKEYNLRHKISSGSKYKDLYKR